MTDPKKPRTKRTPKEKVAAPARVYASAGPYTVVKNGEAINDVVEMQRLTAARAVNKTAAMWNGPGLGGADIDDSDNIGYYNFEFPVDSLEMPQSRRNELKFYRMCYDRDPIVSQAINLHTELPLSKLILEKPKSSSQEFADFIYDFYWQFVTRTKLFEQLLHATREYWLIGEAFIFLEEMEDVELCDVAKEVIEGAKPDFSSAPESFNQPEGADELTILEWISPKDRKSSFKEARSLGITLDMNPDDLTLEAAKTKTALLKKQARLKKISAKIAAFKKVAEPPAEDPKEQTDLQSPLKTLKEQRDADDQAEAQEKAEIQEAEAQEEIASLQKLLGLLERKKTLLQELKVLREERENEYELFSHVTNKTYQGFKSIKLIPPDNIEIKRDPRFGAGPTIFYKPSPEQKRAYLEDPDMDPEYKDTLEQDGLVPLGTDPLEGSSLIHFARKKAPFEDHGRSVLQPVLRTIIYRDKLRQVQTTLASRNMTPKTVVIAPNIPPQEVVALRAHLDEAKSDPDYSIVVNYEMTYNEVGSEGRLLSLDSEWSHTNSDLATGLGFSPELLVGEGFFSGNRVQIELMNSRYMLYRDLVSSLVEEHIFKPIAMKKGFYEVDKYGRPRWIYPKLSFSRLALRDSGDVYEMLYNLYSKGSLPIDIIYEFLNLDPEVCRQKLEQDLFTVMDSKFNQLLDNIYGADASKLFDSTDLVDRMATGLTLIKREIEDKGLEGTGEGS